MAMNTIIREKRRELGLTQEQVAEALGVSAPAVNKWEKGSTVPDTAILPALARLLGVDLNTLFCFHEELSMQEIMQFCNEVTELAAKEGIQAGISKISDKLREYPNCGALFQTVSNLADGMLIMSGLTRKEKEEYQRQITSWYERAARCGDEDVKKRAVFMLASKYLGQGDCEKAQKMVDQLPERSALDKKMLQVNIFMEQGKVEEAIEIMEKSMLQHAGEIWGVLNRLVDLEIAAGNLENAVEIAGISRKASELFSLWQYNAYVGDLSVALAKADISECIEILEKLLSSAFHTWDMEKSPLYYRIAKKKVEGTQLAKQIVPPLLAELEHEEKFEFLRADERFPKLLRKYQNYCSNAD